MQPRAISQYQSKAFVCASLIQTHIRIISRSAFDIADAVERFFLVLLQLYHFSDNTLSIIRLGTMFGWTNRAQTPGILDATAFKSFWVSWDYGVIRVGRGMNVGQDVFMDKVFDSSTINIKYVGVFNGFGSPGSWKFNKGISHYYSTRG